MLSGGLLGLCSAVGCAAPVCDAGKYDGPAVLRTQSDVDGLEGYTEVDVISISGDGSMEPISSLRTLRCLEVATTLTIRGTDIRSLDGLEGLRQVGELKLDRNPQLDDLTALSALEKISGLLSLYDNSALRSLEGLEALQLAGDVNIAFNAALLDLDGFAGLGRVTGRFGAFNNPSLETVSGMTSLVRVGSGLLIENNDSLEPCDDLRLAAQVEVVNGEHLLQSDPADCPGL